MIIGSGLVATSLTPIDSSDKVFFASGVSNSTETRISAFSREQELLEQTLKQYRNKLFIYFSTCSIYDDSVNQRPYIHHKLKMEKLIQTSGVRFLIFRLSNLVGRGGNPNTIMNYFVSHIKQEEEFDLWTNSTRNLLSTDDMVFVVRSILKKQVFGHIINVAYHTSFSVLEIVDRIESFFDIKANVRHSVNKGTKVSIDTAFISSYLTQIDEQRQVSNYITYLLNTYYHEI